MGVARRLGAEGVEHEQLLGRVREVVVAADHVGDPHVGVVDGDREVVERRAVAAGDHQVVLECGSRSCTAPRIRSSTTVAPSSGTRRRIAAPSPPRAARPGSRRAVGFFRRRTTSAGRRVAVGGAGVDQLLEALAMARRALGLADRSLVPVELEPAQGVEDLLDVLWRRPLAVGVLDPQHQGPSRAAGDEPVVECRPRARRYAARRSARGRSGLSGVESFTC